MLTQVVDWLTRAQVDHGTVMLVLLLSRLTALCW